MRPRFYKILSLTAIIVATMPLLFSHTGCAKEYSFEGADTLHHVGPPIPIAVQDELPQCAACDSYADPVSPGQWSLKAMQSQACGTVDTAIINLERTYFTFFGPSACSRDTGMVITVYLENDSLNRSRTNVIVNRVAFYYYDRVTPSYIYITTPNTAFSVLIENYDHQSRIATGRFGGNVFRT
ncbi:MAG TPA: hypothetical protein VI461_16115, partial [Chitinophagaceae bacterium]|nr:hypothetical protein [Chitinophagaceae bacterium]